MKQNTPRWVQSAVKHIHERYGFLFERGYDVFFVDVIDMGRQVTFRKQDVLVRIEESRGEEEIYFRRDPLLPDEFVLVPSVVSSGRSPFRGKLPTHSSSLPAIWYNCRNINDENKEILKFHHSIGNCFNSDLHSRQSSAAR